MFKLPSGGRTPLEQLENEWAQSVVACGWLAIAGVIVVSLVIAWAS